MSGYNRKKGKGLEQDVPSLVGNRGDNRSLANILELSGASGSAHRLSSSNRKTLLGMRNIKDPFSEETQKAIKGFHDYIMTASADDINLEECSLLLSSSAKLFGMQIKAATKHMDELAAFVTNTAKEPVPEQDEGGEVGNKKKRKQKEKVNSEDGKDPKDESIPANSQQDPLLSQNPNTGEKSGATENPSLLKLENTVDASAASSVSVSGVTVGNDTDAKANDSLELAQSVVLGAENCGPGESSIGDSVGDPSLIAQDGSNITEMETDKGESNLCDLDSTEPMGDSIETADTEPGAPAVSTCDINKSDLSSPDVCSPSVEKLNETLLDSQPSASDLLIGGADATTISSPVGVNTAATIILPIQPKAKRQMKEKPEGSPTKKRKLNCILPPQLTSIFDLDLEREELDEDEADSDCEPPLLYPEVDLWNGQFDLDADPDALEVISEPEEVESTTPLVEKLESLQIASQEVQGSSAVESANTTTTVPHPESTNSESSAETLSANAPLVVNALSSNAAADAIVSNDIVVNNDISISENVTNDIDVAAPVVAGADLASASGELNSVNNLPVLAAEDQQEIQNCINQLHYLPFTCELTKEELARTFHSTVGHLETIFKKNNMPFNRQLLKAATVVCAKMVSSFSNRPSNDGHPHGEAALNSFREIFSQGTNGIHSDTIASLLNSEKTIFERTREKSVAESRATIQKRLEEMQRVIVPKYIQWPLIAENTPEFFHRVKQFEQKMKKVLADEEKKESFDVSKYEIEVLAATAMESQEEELMDLEESDDTNASTGMVPPTFTNGNMDEPLSPRLHHRVLSPISTSDSPSSSDSGRKWVPLSNVFHHMKKFDRNECARHFYAVLALLSSQNLDMNYDRHYSEESAAVVTETLDHTQDSKYPRGLKIMTSRCPDADKEEIYVTALASKSCNETFRDLISHEMNLHNDLQHQNQIHSPNRNNIKRSERFLSNGDLHSEPEDEAFVSMNCSTTFAGNLFGGRKKKQN